MTLPHRLRLSGLHVLWPAAALALLGSAPALASANPAADVPVVTRHDVRIGGRELAYTAEAGRIAIRDVATGEPHGYMFYTAYRASARVDSPASAADGRQESDTPR